MLIQLSIEVIEMIIMSWMVIQYVPNMDIIFKWYGASGNCITIKNKKKLSSRIKNMALGN